MGLAGKRKIDNFQEFFVEMKRHRLKVGDLAPGVNSRFRPLVGQQNRFSKNFLTRAKNGTGVMPPEDTLSVFIQEMDKLVKVKSKPASDLETAMAEHREKIGGQWRRVSKGRVTPKDVFNRVQQKSNRPAQLTQHDVAAILLWAVRSDRVLKPRLEHVGCVKSVLQEILDSQGPKP